MIAFLAPPKFVHDLVYEIEVQNEKKIFRRCGDLLLVEGSLEDFKGPPVFFQNLWHQVQRVEFKSISEAARSLGEKGRRWVPYSHQLHRRTQLIQEKLGRIKERPIVYTQRRIGENLPSFGSWVLDSSESLWCSAVNSSKYANGRIEFAQNKIEPPSRAYLKLWEAFSLYTERVPSRSEVCVDLGASPGSWSWVLADLCQQVYAVDRAELDPKVLKTGRIQPHRGDAFKLRPKDFERPIDWFFSDIICDPHRLHELVTDWLAAGFTGRFVCTLKFKGSTDFKAIEKFRSIPGGRIVHLYNNKHEVTWVRGVGK